MVATSSFFFLKKISHVRHTVLSFSHMVGQYTVGLFDVREQEEEPNWETPFFPAFPDNAFASMQAELELQCSTRAGTCESQGPLTPALGNLSLLVLLSVYLGI